MMNGTMPRALTLLLLMSLAPHVAAAQSGGDVAETFVIRPVGNTMAFETTEITAAAGSRITIVLENTATDPAMQHNIALLDAAPDEDEAIRAVGMAAMEAGDDFIPDHPLLLAATPLAAPGERTEITLTVPPPGSYAFVCLFPGHFITMRGTLHVIP